MHRQVRARLSLYPLPPFAVAHVHCSRGQAFEEAYEWGKLGLDLCEKYAQRKKLPDRGQVWELFYCTQTNLIESFLSQSVFSPVSSVNSMFFLVISIRRMAQETTAISLRGPGEGFQAVHRGR
jgi:hypothetical protein